MRRFQTTTEYYAANGDIILPRPSCFDLAATLDCGQAFRYEQRGAVWQGVAHGRVLTVEQQPCRIVFHDMEEDIFRSVFYRYFTLDFDYPALLARFSSDAVLCRAAEHAGGLRLLRQEPFETLVSFIFSQNNNIPRIKGMIARLCETFGAPLGGGFYAFPDAQTLARLEVADLAPVRAGFRAKYLIDAARKVVSGEVPLSRLGALPLPEAREMLLRILGVGSKVADCVLLFGCGHWDAFPVDVWVRRVMQQYYPEGLPACTAGYEGAAQQYLFHCIRNGGFEEDAQERNKKIV